MNRRRTLTRDRRPINLAGRFESDLDLTGCFWARLIEIISLERKPEDAEETERRRAGGNEAAPDRRAGGARSNGGSGLQGSRDLLAELLPLAQRVWRPGYRTGEAVQGARA